METKQVSLEPTAEMIDEGAQRLVRWEDDCVWPDSWSALDVAAARNEAERVWRSMWLAAQPSNVELTGQVRQAGLAGRTQG